MMLQRSLSFPRIFLLCIPLCIAQANLAADGQSDASATIAPNALAGELPDQELVYKRVGDVELKLHAFLPAGHQASDRRSAIVFFFGGGWVGGSPRQFYPHCAYLARRGMVAFAAEYRVKNRHGTTPYECVSDGKSAIRWIREHAAELGIDANRIAAGGGSAGGQVAAAAGTLTGFDEPDENLAIRSRPDALALYNPVFDNGPGGWGHQRVRDQWETFSPAHNIRPGAPPTIVFFGDSDALVPVETARNYDKLMRAAANRSELVVFEGQAHGFFNFGLAGHYYFVETVRAMDRFLASLNFLDGEPTLIHQPNVERDKSDTSP